jgi:hypothetical protein
VHSAPRVIPRLADDVTTARWFEDARLAGCVLKGHCGPTAGRGARGGRRTERIVGALVLNAAAGGIDPDAVAPSWPSG